MNIATGNAELSPLLAKPGEASGAPHASGDLAYRFNGKALSRALAPAEAVEAFCNRAAAAKKGHNGFVWIHCHIESPVLADLLSAGAIDRVAFDLLSAAETRPRCVMNNDGVMLNLRGCAIEPVEGESDLVAVRFWLVNGGIVSAWRRPTSAIAELVSAVGRGFCPHSMGDFVARLCLWIVDTIEPMVDKLSETIDDLELDAVNGSEIMQRREMSEVRRDAIDLRRFLYPQRDAISTFVIEHIAFVHAADRAKLHDAHERLVRFIDELEVTRERCMVLHDEILDNRSIQMNRQVLILSVVSAVFLPISLIAGMLGMNVNGIPAAEGPYGFWLIAGTMAVIISLELAVLRWFKII